MAEGKLTKVLIALRHTLEEEKASIATALEEIRMTQEKGFIPGNRHENSIADRVYDALVGCKRLI